MAELAVQRFQGLDEATGVTQYFQCRRAFLLQQLAKHMWNLNACAAALNQSRDDLILRLEKAGFGYLLKKHVLEAARSSRRKRKKK